MKCSLAILLLCFASVLVCEADDSADTLDISGTYTTTHPREGLGQVIVRFKPLRSELAHEGSNYPSFGVSLWKQRDERVQKLRDGLFGTYTIAAACPGNHGWALLWYSPDDGAYQFNKINRVSPDGDLSIGCQDPSSSDNRIYSVLTRVGDVDPADELEPEDLTLEGVYRYYHSATGHVHVGFERTGETMTVAGGAEIDAYSVTVLSKVGSLGYCPVREGLYGGSFEDDSFPFVGLHTAEDGLWLIWANPGVPGAIRRNRVVSVYPNGDIGIGLGEGESKYVEDTVFRKVAGLETRIRGYSDVINLEGTYDITFGESQSSIRARITATDTVPGRNPGEAIVHRISAVRGGSDNAARASDGLFNGDPFTHVSIVTRDGSGYFVWHSFSHQVTEENLIFEVDADGNFLLVGGEFGQRYIVADFRKLRDPPAEDQRGPGTGPGSATSAPPSIPSTPAVAGHVGFQGGVRAIEARSSLTIVDDPNNQWTLTEIAAIREGLALLPPELRFQDPITVEKLDSVHVLGESTTDFIDLSARRRVLGIRSLSSAGRPDETQASFHRAYLQRSLILNLALLYYDDLPPDTQREWRGFAPWPDRNFRSVDPQNSNPAGYAHASGMDSPELDFATFAVEFFMPSEFRDPMHRARYRLPDRYAFLQNLFGPGPLEVLSLRSTPDVRDWIDPDQVEHIELIVTTPTSSAPQSLAGHILMLIKRNGDYHDGRDSIVLGFVGMTSVDTNNDVDGITYAWRGITGHYPSAIQEETLESLVQRATVLENRDVQRFRLNLSEEETARLIQRFWVIKNAVTYQYRFFGFNCASMLLDTLNYAFDGEKTAPLTVPLVAPLHVAATLKETGRLGDAVYPEYWSIGKKARHAAAKNAGIQDEILVYLRRTAHQSDLLPIEIHDEASSLFSVLLATAPAQIGTDHLFREPIVQLDETQRASAYAQLSSLFVKLGTDYVGDGRAIPMEEYQRLADLLLRYFLNAYDRELYIAVPTEIKRNYPKTEAIPADVSLEFVQEQLRQIQLRNRNSLGIQSLRRALSRFRISLESTHADSSVYVIGREMQSQANAELAAARSNIGWTHGYYPAEFSFGLRTGRAGILVSAGLDVAMFSEALGHNSMFVLRQDMRMVLLSAGVHVGIGSDGGSVSWGEGLNSIVVRGTVFDFQKVLTGDNVDYAGFLNHGFGFTVLDADVELRDETQPIAGADIRLRPLELRYVLNIFESGGFRHFVNLSAGLSYVFERTDGAGDHLFGLPLEVEGKLHPGGALENGLRCFVRYEPLLGANGFLHSLRASTEYSWSPRNNPYANLYAGAEVGLRLREPTTEGISEIPYIQCYLRLR